MAATNQVSQQIAGGIVAGEVIAEVLVNQFIGPRRSRAFKNVGNPAGRR